MVVIHVCGVGIRLVIFSGPLCQGIYTKENTYLFISYRKKSRIPAVIKGNNDASAGVNESAQENRESTLYTEIMDISNTDTHLQTAYNITDKHGSSENRGRFQNTYNKYLSNHYSLEFCTHKIT
jgi:hypothetical protein